MTHRSFRTVLFDLDGTLLDSIGLILASYRHTLRTHRGTAPLDEVWLAGLGTPLHAQLADFTDDPGELEAMVATYREHNLAHHDAMVRAYPGAPEAVHALARQGTRLGVVTSKRRDGTQRGITVGGFAGAFGTVVCADDVERHKPHPEPVLRALEDLGAEPQSTVFVGDSPHDLAAGRAAGVATAAVLWGPFAREDLAAHHPDHWVEQPADLALLGEACA
jgi:pyrophosphatase PpaX